ncbi:unnamed protein product, partial [Arabidopsis halleri]
QFLCASPLFESADNGLIHGLGRFRSETGRALTSHDYSQIQEGWIVYRRSKPTQPN